MPKGLGQLGTFLFRTKPARAGIEDNPVAFVVECLQDSPDLAVAIFVVPEEQDATDAFPQKATAVRKTVKDEYIGSAVVDICEDVPRQVLHSVASDAVPGGRHGLGVGPRAQRPFAWRRNVDGVPGQGLVGESRIDDGQGSCDDGEHLEAERIVHRLVAL